MVGTAHQCGLMLVFEFDDPLDFIGGASWTALSLTSSCWSRSATFPGRLATVRYPSAVGPSRQWARHLHGHPPGPASVPR